MTSLLTNSPYFMVAAVGLYGVLAYPVIQRTGKIGIRVALGARRERVLQLVLIDGLRPALLGFGIGIALSLGVTRLISSVRTGQVPLMRAFLFSVIVTYCSPRPEPACFPPGEARGSTPHAGRIAPDERLLQ